MEENENIYGLKKMEWKMTGMISTVRFTYEDMGHPYEAKEYTITFQQSTKSFITNNMRTIIDFLNNVFKNAEAELRKSIGEIKDDKLTETKADPGA